jgi:uncharacterized protein (TIGR02594 family)
VSEPRWITAARAQLGQAEIHGRKHNPRILKWWIAIRAPFTDDETPWCAGFVGGQLESVGIKSSRSAAARSYLKWGKKLTAAAVGCIVVFSRGPVNGHVGFVVGQDSRGNLMVLGGNQGDAVNIKAFSTGNVLGYRWPAGESGPATFVLPRVSATSTPPVRSKDDAGSLPVSLISDMPAEPAEPAGNLVADGDITAGTVKPAPVVVEAAEPDDTKPHAAPEGDRKTGITEGAKVVAGGGIVGVLTQAWDTITQAPDTIVQALFAMAQKPAFWAFAVVIGGGAYVWWRRRNMKRAAA